MSDQKRQTYLPEKTAKGGCVIMPPDSQPDSKKYNGLIDKVSIKQEEDSEERQERGPQPSLGPHEEEDRGKEKDTSDAADVKTEPASEGSGGAAGENHVKEAEEERILEVLRVADELDNCLDDIGKEQSKTEQRLSLADDSKEIRHLSQKRTVLVHLANLIRKRMKELMEDCWKAIGEKSKGEESFGALFKKIGEIRKEATKELQGLKQRHRTAKIDKRIENYERKLNRLQKADDNLLYDLRILAIGCQKKLETIKEGKVDEVKTEVKEEPESSNQDQVITAAVDHIHLEEDVPILKEEAVEEEMNNGDPENQNQELHDHVDFGGRMEDHLEESADDSALVATPTPLFEVQKLVDELDKCQDDIRKEQSETKELFGLTDDAKQIIQMAQKRVALVNLANLIPQRLKELKEEGCKAMGEKSEGEESIGDLFKKSREEVTEELQGLKLGRRTSKTKKEIEDCQRKLHILQKTENKLVYDLRILAIGCQAKLKNIKEGGGVEVKTEIEEEPEPQRRLDEETPQDQELFDQVDYFAGVVDDDGMDYVDMEGRDISSKKGKKRKVETMVEEEMKESGEEDTEMEEEPVSPNKEPLNKRGPPPVLATNSNVKKKETSEEPERKRRSARKAKIVTYFEEEEKEEGDSSSEESEEESSGSDDDEEWTEKTKKRMRVFESEKDGSDDDDDESEDDELKKEDQEKDCPVYGCSEKCPSEESLWKHMRIHPKPVLCKTCQDVFKTSQELRRHYRVHTGARPFKCTYCKRKFSQAYHLKRHSRLHTGEEPFECDKCEKKFSDKSVLNYHRRKHSEENMFPCNICDYRSASTGHLKRHMRTHTGEKPFKCTDCGHCFSDKAHLEEHKASVHLGQKKHACKECDFKTAYSSAVSRHMKRMHKK